ncbi:unnamed protein product [Vitrella brassicaformis CCMP3155]|uniref:Uncharacterized protein n=1 Tax=Vitrella brassicaformis (strain CCMP3155) TaxID=1169540 RepID=A0A0G4GCZ6_VITBC|nr:unnamed protein product [Vitrella brassicaformis CCMP3155]|eukprot:CEM26737.1 unnamed protein product [Vitrella brassicaformis CCMP3155]
MSDSLSNAAQNAVLDGIKSFWQNGQPIASRHQRTEAGSLVVPPLFSFNTLSLRNFSNQVEGLSGACVPTWCAKQAKALRKEIPPQQLARFDSAVDALKDMLNEDIRLIGRRGTKIMNASFAYATPNGSASGYMLRIVRQADDDYDVTVQAISFSCEKPPTYRFWTTTTHEKNLFFESSESQVHKEMLNTPITLQEVGALFATVVGMGSGAGQQGLTAEEWAVTALQNGQQ